MYPERASIPRSVIHRISATFMPAEDAPPARIAFFPASATETGGRVTTSTKEPVVLGAPVAGSGWGGFACCDQLNGHRGAVLPVGGAISGTERFAIDFGVFALRSAPITRFSENFLLESGTDGTRNEDYVSYGAPLLAVADATVVKVVDDVPDTAPGAAPGGKEGLAVNDAGGNVIVFRIAPRLFAFYLHNASGSATVKVGDKATKGQKIAELGSSGNSQAPHFHFQLGRSRQMLTTENVPFVFEDFDLEGTITDAEVVVEPTPRPHEDELPLWDTIVDFPKAR